MSDQTLDCVKNPITNVQVNSGYWIDKIYNSCGSIGSSAGGNKGSVFTCKNANTSTGGGIVSVNYVEDGTRMEQIQFVCDDGTTSNMYGLNRSGQYPTKFNCPSKTYLAKITAGDMGYNGISNPRFGCTINKEAEAIRIAEEARIAKLAEDDRIAKLAEEARMAKLAEDARIAKLAEEARIAEDARIAEEARIAEAAKLTKDTPQSPLILVAGIPSGTPIYSTDQTNKDPSIVAPTPPQKSFLTNILDTIKMLIENKNGSNKYSFIGSAFLILIFVFVLFYFIKKKKE